MSVKLHSLVALKIFQIFRKQGTKLTLFIYVCRRFSCEFGAFYGITASLWIISSAIQLLVTHKYIKNIRNSGCFFVVYLSCRVREALLRRPAAAGCSRSDRLLPLLVLLCGRVGVGFLLHAGRAFFAVGVRGEHFLYGRGFCALGELDQLAERVGHAVGAESMFYAKFETVLVRFVLLFL